MVPFRFNRTLTALACIGIILYLIAVNIYNSQGEENPDAVLNKPSVTMKAAEQIAIDWFKKENGIELDKAELVVHSFDKLLSVYVEKNELTQTYQDQYDAKFPLEYWRVTLKPGNGYTYYVRVGMDQPRVIGWEAPRTVHGGNISSGQDAKDALTAAGYRVDEFTYTAKGMNENTGEIDIERYDPNAFDFLFTSTKDKIGDAPLVIGVNLWNGDALSLVPSFEPPSDFKQWLNEQDSGATIMSFVYMFFAFLFGVISLILAIINRKKARFSRGVVFTLVVFGIISLYMYSSYPSQIANLDVSGLDVLSPMVLTITNVIVYALLGTALYFNAVAGDQIWRARGWNPWPRWKDANFGTHVYYSMGRGYLLCLFILGVQQVLFLIAYNTFDTFSVNDTSQSMYNQFWPWLFPALAWYAGIGEEITFRLFGIALFRKLLPEGKGFSRTIIRFASILLPSLIWAAGHTTYAFYPNYTRLFEVAVLGMIFGYAFLRYGLYTAIFAHVSMDLILMSLAYMFETPTGGGILLGFLYMASPYLLSLIILFLHRASQRKRQEPSPYQPEPLYP